MPQGKRWSVEECEALARAWINISEDVGSEDLKGTDQTADVFWKRVIAAMQRLAPPDCVGRYHNRAQNAIMTQWTDKIAREVRKFNKSLLKVHAAHLTGVNDEQKINIAVSITMGKIDAPSYRFKDYESSAWMYYRAWLILRDHAAFRPPTPRPAVTVDEEEEFEPEESEGRGPNGGNGEPDDGIPQTISTTGKSRGDEISHVTSVGRRRGPGPGKHKTKAMEAQAKWRKEKSAMLKELVVASKERTEEMKQFVKNHATMNAFKIAFMGYQANIDDPIKRRKYEKVMHDITNVDSAGENEDTQQDDDDGFPSLEAV
jgi:hypothetical protein